MTNSNSKYNVNWFSGMGGQGAAKKYGRKRHYVISVLIIADIR